MTPVREHSLPVQETSGEPVNPPRARLWPWILLALLGGAAASATAPLAQLVTDGRIQAMDLMSDPAEITGAPWFIGIISDLALYAWAAAAGLFGVLFLGRWRHERHLALLAGLLGALTLVLLLDDWLLLHEIVVPWLVGVSEGVVFTVYGVTALVLVLVFRRELLARRESFLLLLALMFLGLSVLVDGVGRDSDVRRVIEEAAKLIGALAWAAFPAALVVHGLSTHPRR